MRGVVGTEAAEANGSYKAIPYKAHIGGFCHPDKGLVPGPPTLLFNGYCLGFQEAVSSEYVF